jgi:hypothetical protein
MSKNFVVKNIICIFEYLQGREEIIKVKHIKNFTIMKANEILEIGNEIFSTSERKSIYRKEIFVECKTDKEKKNLRMKLRKKLDAFIAEFIATSKNEEKRKALRKAWQEYAKQVYINSSYIVDANANTEKKDTIKNFLLAMNETEKKNK